MAPAGLGLLIEIGNHRNSKRVREQYRFLALVGAHLPDGAPPAGLSQPDPFDKSVEMPELA